MNATKTTAAKPANFDHLPDFLNGAPENDTCPCHGTPIKKSYTYGSTMSAETDVYVFSGCKCAVSVRHDPVGTYDSVAQYHDNFGDAAGTGKLHAMRAATKYR